MTFEKGTNLQYLIDRKNDANLTIMLDNGIPTEIVTIALMGISFPAHALSAIEANALILEDVSFQAQTIEVIIP